MMDNVYRTLRVIVLASVFSLLFPTLILAEKRSMRIQWISVAGAHGYSVQWTSVDENIPAERRTMDNHIELNLDAGRYRIRVSALNRFGKPAEWSAWKEFQIRDTDRIQSLDLSRPKEEVEQENLPAKNALPLWKQSIPGYLQIKSGQPRGWAYPSVLAILGIYAWDQKRRGDIIAGDLLNDPDFLTPLSVNSYAPIATMLWVRRGEQRRLYDGHQRNQRLAGYAAVAVIATHWVDLTLWSDERTSVVVLDGSLAIRLRF